MFSIIVKTDLKLDKEIVKKASGSGLQSTIKCCWPFKATIDLELDWEIVKQYLDQGCC